MSADNTSNKMVPETCIPIRCCYCRSGRENGVGDQVRRLLSVATCQCSPCDQISSCYLRRLWTPGSRTWTTALISSSIQVTRKLTGVKKTAICKHKLTAKWHIKNRKNHNKNRSCSASAASGLQPIALHPHNQWHKPPDHQLMKTTETKPNETKAWFWSPSMSSSQEMH